MRKLLGVVCLLGALALAGVAIEVLWDPVEVQQAHGPLMSPGGLQAA